MTSSDHPGTEENFDIIRQLYAGINRNDIEFVVNLMDSKIVRIEPEGFPTAGTYRGQAAMRAHLYKGRNTWAEGACVPVDFITAGNKIVVPVHVKVRLKNNPEWIDGWIADGFVIKEGRITEFHSFADNQKAFEWAGMNPGIH